jgi:hypothetical protein
LTKLIMKIIREKRNTGCYSRRVARSCLGLPVLAGGGRGCQRGRGGTGKGLIGARAVVERWCNGRRRWRRLKLGSRAGESGEEVRWWLDVLRCLYRGPGRAEKAAMGCNQ